MDMKIIRCLEVFGGHFDWFVVDPEKGYIPNCTPIWTAPLHSLPDILPAALPMVLHGKRSESIQSCPLRKKFSCTGLK